MTFDEFIAELRRRTPQPVPAGGIRDIDGREIRTGDIVLFYFSADTGFSPTLTDSATRCLDVVEERGGGFAAMDYDTTGGMWLWKVDGVCRVVGDIHTDPEPLRDLYRFADPLASLLEGIGYLPPLKTTGAPPDGHR